MAEEWRDVAGHEGAYQVSDHGRVRSLSRVVIRGDGQAQSVRERILRPQTSHHGYLHVTLSGERAKIHKLVLSAFVGPCPEGMEGAHSDGYTANNRLSNLRYATHAENIADKKRHGTQTGGETHPLAKLSAVDVAAIRQACATEARRAVASRYGIAISHLGRIVRGEAWA